MQSALRFAHAGRACEEKRANCEETCATPHPFAMGGGGGEGKKKFSLQGGPAM